MYISTNDLTDPLLKIRPVPVQDFFLESNRIRFRAKVSPFRVVLVLDLRSSRLLLSTHKKSVRIL